MKTRRECSFFFPKRHPVDDYHIYGVKPADKGVKGCSPKRPASVEGESLYDECKRTADEAPRKYNLSETG